MNIRVGVLWYDAFDKKDKYRWGLLYYRVCRYNGSLIWKDDGATWLDSLDKIINADKTSLDLPIIQFKEGNYYDQLPTYYMVPLPYDEEEFKRAKPLEDYLNGYKRSHSLYR